MCVGFARLGPKHITRVPSHKPPRVQKSGKTRGGLTSLSEFYVLRCRSPEFRAIQFIEGWRKLRYSAIFWDTQKLVISWVSPIETRSWWWSIKLSSRVNSLLQVSRVPKIWHVVPPIWWSYHCRTTAKRGLNAWISCVKPLIHSDYSRCRL